VARLVVDPTGGIDLVHVRLRPILDADLYFFVLLYAMLFVAVASLLYPDKMDEYASFGDYFQSRRRWFYGLLTVMFHRPDRHRVQRTRALRVARAGIPNPSRLAGGRCDPCSALGQQAFSGLFVAVALVDQVIWIAPMFNTPS
jgi:hypothetical protein